MIIRVMTHFDDLFARRLYYRCTHHYSEQNCPAKKQVQQDCHDSSLFHVTYQGKHTCNAITTPKLVLDSILQEEPSFISYESIPNIYNETTTRTTSNPRYFLPDWSNGNINFGLDIDSFDIEYGDLVFFPQLAQPSKGEK
jgi:hypothetical protein